MAKHIVLFLALVLGACQSAPPQSAAPQQTARPASEPEQAAPREQAALQVKDDCNRYLADPAIDPIRARLAVELDAKNTPRMLADKSKPNKTEKAAILAYALKREECARIGFEWLRKSYVPMQLVLAEAQQAQSRLLLADLYGGKISYGQFATRRQAQIADSRARRVEFERLIAEKSPESQKGAQLIVDEYRKNAERDTRAAINLNKRNAEWMRLFKAVSQ